MTFSEASLWGLAKRQGGVHLPQWGGSQHKDLKPEETGASGLYQMLPVAFVYVEIWRYCVWKFVKN